MINNNTYADQVEIQRSNVYQFNDLENDIIIEYDIDTQEWSVWSLDEETYDEKVFFGRLQEPLEVFGTVITPEDQYECITFINADNRFDKIEY